MTTVPFLRVKKRIWVKQKQKKMTEGMIRDAMKREETKDDQKVQDGEIQEGINAN